MRFGRPGWSQLLMPTLTIVFCACSEGGASEKNELPVTDTVAAKPAAKGTPPVIAQFFAGTKIDGKCPNDTTCVYVQTFPTGDTREITLRVSPGQKYAAARVTPGSSPISGFKFASSTDANSTVRIDMNYFVAKAGLPKSPPRRAQGPSWKLEGRQGVALVQLASLQTSERRRGTLRQVAARADETEGAGIYWGEMTKKGADVGIGALLDYAKEEGVKGAKSIPSIYALASTLSAVSEAMELSKQHGEWLKELDELEKCAANPTNRVARSDPNYSKNTVAKIQSARSELTEVTGVRFLNQMTEKGAELTPVTAVMSVGLKDGFAWSEQTLGDYSKNTIMREAEVAVVKCGDPGNAAGNLVLESECTTGRNGNDHTVTRVTADVSWEWKGGVKYDPHGTYNYSSVRTVGPACTITSTASGTIEDTGWLFVFPPARAKELGYTYEARFVNWPAKVTISVAGPGSCGIATTLPQDIDWIPVMHGDLGTGGTIQGEMPAPACITGQPSTLKWSFSVPAAKK